MGTVTKVEWTNPHIWFYMDVKNPDGSVANWGFEMAGPAQFLRAGFDGTEGIISMPDGSVLFCEQNANKIIHIGLDGRFSTYLEDSNRTIGLGYDRKGRLIAAQSREPRVGVLMPARTTLADSFDGQPLVRPNDLVIDRKGGIYFTDPIPNPGTGFREPPPGRKPLLFYITPRGSVIK